MRRNLWAILLATFAMFTQSSCQRESVSGVFNSNKANDVLPQPLYVRLPQALLTKEFVQRTQFNRDHKFDDVFAFGYLPKLSMELLSSDELSNLVELDNSWQQLDFDAKSLNVIAGEAIDGDGKFEGYHNYEALTTELQSIASDFPEIVQLTSAGKSVQGRELWLVKISDHAADDEAEPKLLYIANMHGDEVVGREMMVYLIRKLTSEYNTSDRIANLVNHGQIYIMPSMNPDGFEMSQRSNARGRDLNRNFPDFTSDPSDTLDGREVETQAIMKLHQQHHFVLAINFHGGAVCFNMPWDTTPNSSLTERFGDDPLMSRAARSYADANPTMLAGEFERGVTYGYEWYEVDGGMQDWANYYRRSIHATVELSNTKWPSASNLATHWQENGESLISYLEKGLVGAHLQVTDATGNILQNVSVQVSSAPRELAYDNGVIHRPTVPTIGQKIRIEAEGFKSQAVDFNPAVFADEFTNVVLEAK